MDLILWRHAEAVTLDQPLPDYEAQVQADLQRALTPKGERQAQRMAQWLNQRLAETTRVLVSPAVRAQQTAEALERSFKTVKTIAPGAPAHAVIQAAKWPDSIEPVLIVGHQPTLGNVASFLLGGAEQNWSIKKGAVWWLRSRTRDEHQVVLVAVQTVELL